MHTRSTAMFIADVDREVAYNYAQPYVNGKSLVAAVGQYVDGAVAQVMVYVEYPRCGEQIKLSRQQKLAYNVAPVIVKVY